MKTDYRIQYMYMGKQKKKSGFNKTGRIILWILFICLNIMVMILFTFRVVSFNIRLAEEIDFESFPDDCSFWAKANGCTRINRYVGDCVRERTIPNNYPIYYNFTYNGIYLADIVYDCAINVGYAVEVYPNDYIDSDDTNFYMHLVVENDFFGFLNDFYINVNSRSEFNSRVYVAA